MIRWRPEDELWDLYCKYSPADLSALSAYVKGELERVLQFQGHLKDYQAIADDGGIIKGDEAIEALSDCYRVLQYLLYYHIKDGKVTIPPWESLPEEDREQIAGYRAAEHIDKALEVINAHPDITTIEEFKAETSRPEYQDYGQAIVRAIDRLYKQRYGKGRGPGWKGFKDAVFALKSDNRTLSDKR